LRDGEQAPGASLTPEQKLTIAKQLESLGVNAIETGFPASSKEDFEAGKLIAANVRKPLLTALTRCLCKDIEITAEALKRSHRFGITLFLATSPLLRKYSLGKSKEDVLEMVNDSVTYARKFTDNVAFGAEDASRTEPEFLYKVYEEAIDSGAVVVGFTDTVGWLIPEDVKDAIGGIKKSVRNINEVLLGIHFHNDLGLAVANSLIAVEAGANIVQGTINGIGERAGNASLEEVVMALKVRKDYYKSFVTIDTKQLFKTSQMVAELTGLSVSPNKAVVGDNVFATEAGIHQAALIKERLTYEIIKPEDVGQKGTSLVLGRHSGKHAVYYRLRKLGYHLVGEPNTQLDMIYNKFKEVAATKKEIADSDLIEIANEVLGK
jgi:2-isopropylmalate synthase